MLNTNISLSITCIIKILLVSLQTEVTIRIIKIKYKINIMGNPFNPYNLETVKYSGTCNGITGETVSSYNVRTTLCDTSK